MAKITAARLAKKQTLSTNDAYCVRIERRDGVTVRYTNYDKDLTMSTKVDKNGNAIALSSDVTYHSIQGYTPSAFNNQADLNPNTFDLEGILDAVEQASGTSERVTTFPPFYMVSTGETAATSAANTIDGDTGTSWISSENVNQLDTFSKADDEVYLEARFKSLVPLNKIRINVPSQTLTYVKVEVSFDQVTYYEVSPMQDRGAGGGWIEIDLPDTYRVRRVRLIFGPNAASGAAYKPQVKELEFQNYLSGDNASSISRNDIVIGRFNNARIYVFVTDALSPVEDEEKMLAGFWGNVELTEGKYTAEVKSLADILNEANGRFYTAKCDAELGSNRCGIKMEVDSWSANMFASSSSSKGLGLSITTDKRFGTIIKPTTENTFYYLATTVANPGKSGSSEPTWPTVAGNTVVDGDITWTAILAYTYNGTVGTVTDARRIFEVGFDPYNGTGTDLFAEGVIEFLSGDNKGVKANIKSSSGSKITLKERLPADMSNGDQIKIKLGCRKRFSTDCKTKFGNGYNFQGFPYLPGAQVIRKFGGQG